MSAPGDSKQPDPPRFHRLKRWSTIGVLIALLLVALHWWWGYEANRRLDAFIAAAHVRGERITVEDFNKGPPIPDENNAAIPLQAAASAVKLTPAQDTWDGGFEAVFPITSTDRDMIHEITYAHRAAIAQARSARSRTQSDYGVHMTSPVASVMLPYLGPARALIAVQLFGVFDAHLAHNDAEAVELLRDIDHHVNALGQSQPFLVILNFCIYRQMSAAHLIVQLAPDLDISGPSQATTRPASRENVRALIDELLDDRDFRASARSAMEAEQFMALDAGPSMAARMNPQWVAELLAPLYLLDSLRAAAQVDPHRIAATQPNYQAANRFVSPPIDPRGRSGLHATVDALGGRFNTMRSNAHLWQFRALTARRGAALALAIRLYEVDHGGKLPARLEDLVPNYCAALPADPFDAAGKTFIYRPQGSPPMLYSVGVNGVDDQGNRGNLDWWERVNPPAPDLVITLTPTPATTQPAATQPGS